MTKWKICSSFRKKMLGEPMSRPISLRITVLLCLLGLAACATTDKAKPVSPDAMVKQADDMVAVHDGEILPVLKMRPPRCFFW